MILLEAEIKYSWRCCNMNASSINTGVNDSANFGYNVQVGCIVLVDKLADYKRYCASFNFERGEPRVRRMKPLRIALKNEMKIYTFGVFYLKTSEVSIKMNHIHTKLEDKTTKDQLDISIAYILIDG
jgi:hypothetical protein